MVKIEDANKDNVLLMNNLLDVDDLLEVKIYLGNTNEHIIKVAKVIKIYDKIKYNMLLCDVETKNKLHYYTCINQYKQNNAIFY